MRAKNFILTSETYVGSAASESFVVTSSNVQIRSTDIIGQFGLALSSSDSYANQNLHILSRTVTNGLISGNFGKSAPSDATIDSIDVITISAKG